MLQRHLKRQHRDRQVYWSCRAQSRLDSCNPYIYHLTGILDSMDAAKHAWPRSRMMSAKDFSSFNRPRLTSTTLILHGHMVCMALSPSSVTANSSRTCEILSHGMTLLSRTVDLRGVNLSLQGDNSCKELKNNACARLLASWISLHKLRSGQMAFLSSGHSHEDIDAFFGHVRNWINSHQELPTPLAFQQCLQAYFNDSTRRPHEKHRTVVMLREFRDWSLDIGSLLFSVVICFGYFTN